VRENRNELIKGALDAGAAGIMVPMVNSGDEARRAVASAKYPPAGKRGFGPWRASNYYTDVSGYMKNANAITTIVLQIESIEAVRKIDEIASTPQADVLFVGPADLALSMDLPLGSQHEQLSDAYRTVIAAARKSGKAAGIDRTSLGLLATYLELGFTFFTYGADTSYLIDGARAASRDFRLAAEQKK
jgi:2-keto-3-deoxy-L-rhamnonate aldolase RhmA